MTMSTFASTVHRITVDEYERIIRAGALENPGKVELIDGYLVDKMAKNPEHSFSATSAHEMLKALLPAGWSARKEEPVRIPAYDEPEPDVSVVRGITADYRHRIPEPADVALLVEVSDSSLSQDLGPKLSAYAKAGIPVYWIANLVDGQVEVYSNPGHNGYQTHEVLAPGHMLRVVIDGVEVGEIPVADILP
jgi:Uma2 family endonuclease